MSYVHFTIHSFYIADNKYTEGWQEDLVVFQMSEIMLIPIIIKFITDVIYYNLLE